MLNNQVQSELMIMPPLQPKSLLRKEIRNRRDALDSVRQDAASVRLLEQLLSITSFRSARSIAMYLANDGEIDPVRVMQWCWENARIPYVPIVEGSGAPLIFAPVAAQTRFRQNRFGIREPVVAQNRMITAQQLDLVLVPLVAFDQSGNRLGMGGGFYDRTFEFLADSSMATPELIGIAHEIQKVEHISAESWDIPLTTVVTDERVYSFGHARQSEIEA